LRKCRVLTTPQANPITAIAKEQRPTIIVGCECGVSLAAAVVEAVAYAEHVPWSAQQFATKFVAVAPVPFQVLSAAVGDLSAPHVDGVVANV
jgi:hypothetical protein